MNKKDLVKNTAIAFAAQGVSMVISAVQSLLIPKVLGVTEFGYWQLFIFYMSYTGVFHLGLNDGVYLLKGGQSRAQIDKESVKSQFVFGALFQSILALAIVVIALLGTFGPERQFVIGATAIFMVLSNASLYLMYTLQAMNETRLSSYATIVNKAAFLVPLMFLLVSRTMSFRPYVIWYVLASGVQLLYCVWQCRDILAAHFRGMGTAISEACESIRCGSKLMLATLSGMLIMGVVRFAIDTFWGIETFGRVSLSISLVNFFLQFISQAAMVLFPALRQSGESEVRGFYQFARDILGVAFPAVYLLYFPMVWILGIWLPSFVESLRYFALLIPICVFDSKMNITCTTLFKVRREEGVLLRINLATVALCAVLAFTAALCGQSPVWVVSSATLAIMVRSLISERVMSSELSCEVDDVSIWEVGLTVAFVGLVFYTPSYIAICAYGGLYALFVLLHRNIVGRAARTILHS